MLPNLLNTTALAAFAGAATLLVAPAYASQTPDALVRQISTEVIDVAKTDKAIQAGDMARITALVDSKVMPSVNFEVATRSAVGPQWRSATPEQRARLQTEFKTLLLRLYAGALTQLKDQTVSITRTLPTPGSTQVIVQSEVKGSGEPSSSTTASTRPVRCGRSSTSTSAASGWCRTTARSSPPSWARAASTV